NTQPTILTIGLRIALTTPKIRATPRSVSPLDATEAVVSSMPGTTAVATARAAAEASRRIRNRMPHLGITGVPHQPGGAGPGAARPAGPAGRVAVRMSDDRRAAFKPALPGHGCGWLRGSRGGPLHSAAWRPLSSSTVPGAAGGSGPRWPTSSAGTGIAPSRQPSPGWASVPICRRANLSALARTSTTSSRFWSSSGCGTWSCAAPALVRCRPPAPRTAPRPGARARLLVRVDGLMPVPGRPAIALFPAGVAGLIREGLAAHGPAWRLPMPAGLFEALIPAGSVPEAVRQDYLDRIRAHPAASFI